MSWAWIGSGRLAANTTATAALDNIGPSLTGPSFPWIQASDVSMSPDHRGRERAQPVGTNHAPCTAHWTGIVAALAGTMLSGGCAASGLGGGAGVYPAGKPPRTRRCWV